jgi:hypothetical protein
MNTYTALVSAQVGNSRKLVKTEIKATCALRTQFNQVVVALTKRDQADQLQKLVALAKHLRVKANALYQQVNPLFRAELFACLNSWSLTSNWL